MRILRSILIAYLTVLPNILSAQVFDPVKWEFNQDKVSDNEYEISFKATIENNWYMYGFNPEWSSPLALVFEFETVSSVEFLTEIQSSVKPKVKYDEQQMAKVESFSKEVTFSRKLKVTDPENALIKGYIGFSACDNMRCIPPNEAEFQFFFGGKTLPEKLGEEVAKAEDFTPMIPTLTFNEEKTDKETTEVVIFQEEVPQDKSLLYLLLFGIAMGFVALATPCVFPIIPLTVSYFSMGNKTKKASVSSALVFGISIVLIYTLVGFIAGITRFDLISLIQSHWLPNLVIFILFLILAVSFFGVFEISLPSSMANKIDAKADQGGVLGPFFMALATVVISFSCTGLFVGSILGAALQGEIIKPVVGMFGFSVAFATPFTLLAIFPKAIEKLPKSGGWLNSVKVVFAFLLIFFSLIFLGNLGIVGRNFILVIGIVTLSLQGFYLLGKIKFSHDSEVAHIGVFRLLLILLSFSAALYLLPGLFGAPLTKISAFLPAQEQFSIYTNSDTISESIVESSSICDAQPKHSDFLHLPHNIKGYFDYEEGMACAKEQGKPALVYFVGHNCKNCKNMYATVWTDKRVQQKLMNEVVLIALYTDDRTKLPEEEWITSNVDGRLKNTIGKVNNNIEVERFKTNAMPLYVMLDNEGKQLTPTYAYNPKAEKFLEFLVQGIEKYKKVEGSLFEVER